jgi:hypothetical protein
VKGRGGVLRRKQVEHRSPAEKLEYILEFRFPDLAFELEELEDALAEGLSLTEAIDAVMDDNEIPAEERAQFAAELQAARELKSEAQSSERSGAVEFLQSARSPSQV